MRKLFRNFLLFVGLVLGSVVFAADNNDFYLDKTQVVLQQIDLLKNRIMQAKVELDNLKHNQKNQRSNLSIDHVNKQWLNWTKLDIAGAKSNLDSINIELSEAQQMTALLEKDTQDLLNQINAFNVFGTKIAKNGAPNLSSLRAQLSYQKNLLRLESERLNDLQELQSTANKTLQIYTAKYDHIETLLKSQTMMQLKERQSKNEVDFQQQQNMWLRHLNVLYAELKHLEQSKDKKHSTYVKLENEIFYANENVNFMYLQMLIVRYQDQIQQLKLSTSRGSSVSLLNKISDQAQALGKQFSRVKNLLAERMNTLQERKDFLVKEKLADENYLNQVSDLEIQYHAAENNVAKLSKELTEFRVTLDDAIQEELSSRQGLLGFSANAWMDLGNDILLVPTLTYQVGKSFAEAVFKLITTEKLNKWILFIALEMGWISLFYIFNKRLRTLLNAMQDHERGHLNLKWIAYSLLQRNIIDIVIVGNLFWLFKLSQIPAQYFRFLLDIGGVWLLFKSLIVMAKLCFVETMHDYVGYDSSIYQNFRRIIISGGCVTVLTVFITQLPVIYELKDLFYRLFLLFLAILSVFLFRSRKILTSLVLPHIDNQHTYLKRIVRSLSVLIPLAIFVNSVIGLFGFINFVLIISWYEGIFFLVLVAYLIVKGLLGELMDCVSQLLITRVKNGWLYTEALLKPLEKIFQILLLFLALAVLFLLYGWDKQSFVVLSIVKLLHYPIANILGTTITLISFAVLILMALFLYWSARWIREFVYRMMSSRTNDLGIRTSIAILSQYTLILCGVLIGLRLLGIDLKALTFIVSAFALGVGLGLRDIANNFVCGFLLLFERPLRVGDTVCIGGFEGDVVHIGGRAVTVRTFDHMDVLVPNADIFSKTFTNWTGQDHIVRTVAIIKIHHHDSPHDVQTLIYQVLATLKNVLSDPAPEVFLKELTEGLVEFEVRYYINLRQVKSRTSVRSEVLMAIWELFEKSGIKPPYPHHEVFVSNKLPSLIPVIHSREDSK